MRRSLLPALVFAAALAPGLPNLALAQVVSPLPLPAVSEDAPPGAFLRAARLALATGRDGEAMEALERAESRLLIRSVRPSLAGQASEQTAVRSVGTARRALAAGDRTGALQGIDAALRDPEIDVKSF